jgi:metal-responsive CopG/Arc/MetJ family transcriptional regulator
MTTIRNKPLDKQAKDTVRASISFPLEDYRKLEQVATKKRVSMAWIVRDAVRKYLEGNQVSEGES